MRAPEAGGETHQTSFHRRWGSLHDPSVRDLAWLLDSPDLLDPAAPQWEGQVALLPHDTGARSAPWLHELDASPHMLHAAIDACRTPRVGRYAENLLAFYFREQGVLAAHGLQVRASPGDTIGEFDFLLRQGDALVHWEMATKFYLLATDGDDARADYFVGPNLADSLHAKMRKIMRRQLALATHPCAQPLLPGPISEARAFIKGWLFYPIAHPAASGSAGVSPDHCRGRWLTLAGLVPEPRCRFMLLPRLRWLAPVQAELARTLSGDELKAALAENFLTDNAPVMAASLEQGDNGFWREKDRFFVVPGDWRSRALQRCPGIPADIE